MMSADLRTGGSCGEGIDVVAQPEVNIGYFKNIPECLSSPLPTF